MRLLDHSFSEPAYNLALDEILLNRAEEGRAGETLRFWESQVPFVVLGVAQTLGGHVDEEACQRDAISIHRRCSAGGCVLQGPGCLNFTLILSQEKRPNIRTIRGSYRFILERIGGALQKRGIPAEPAGVSDLALHGKKFSGSAQRRRKTYILHHGTLLHRADTSLMAKYLREPTDQPHYRAGRNHHDFVRDLSMAPHQLKETICKAFHVPGPPTDIGKPELEETRTLAETKYQNRDWVTRR